MLHAAWVLLRDSGTFLPERAPEGVDPDQIGEHLLETGHEHEVDNLHVWTVTSDLPALSAHVFLDASCVPNGHCLSFRLSCGTA